MDHNNSEGDPEKAACIEQQKTLSAPQQ